MPDVGMMSDIEEVCRNFGQRTGCLEKPDPKFVMRFDDIGKPPVHWCSFCGPESHAIDRLLVKALATRGPKFAQKMREVVDKSIADAAKGRS